LTRLVPRKPQRGHIDIPPHCSLLTYSGDGGPLGRVEVLGEPHTCVAFAHAHPDGGGVSHHLHDNGDLSHSYRSLLQALLTCLPPVPVSGGVEVVQRDGRPTALAPASAGQVPEMQRAPLIKFVRIGR